MDSLPVGCSAGPAQRISLLQVEQASPNPQSAVFPLVEDKELGFSTWPGLPLGAPVPCPPAAGDPGLRVLFQVVRASNGSSVPLWKQFLDLGSPSSMSSPTTTLPPISEQ